jgi:chemotaxis protein methyltransferase CheR
MLATVQRPGTRAFRLQTAPVAPLPEKPVVVWRPQPETEPQDVPKVVAAPPRPPRLAAHPEEATEVRLLADAGQLSEAAARCAAAIVAQPLDHRLHFLDGVIARARGDDPAAEAALRRAIYLSKDMVMAHYHLGLLLLSGTAPRRGSRALGITAMLCRGLPAETLLPEGDGMTASDLLIRLAPLTEPMATRV